MKVGAIITAAGQGKRIGTSVPKQFLKIQGKPLLHHTLTVFSSCKLIDYVVLVMPQADVDAMRDDWLKKYEIVREVEEVLLDAPFSEGQIGPRPVAPSGGAHLCVFCSETL